MPHTILAAGQEGTFAEGVFENPTLAERYLRRNDALRSLRPTIIPMKGPMQPENALSLDALKKACNFALMQMYSIEKTGKAEFFQEAMERLEKALGEKAKPIKHNYQIRWKDGTSNTLAGFDLKDALRSANYPASVIQGHDYFIKSFKDLGEV